MTNGRSRACGWGLVTLIGALAWSQWPTSNPVESAELGLPGGRATAASSGGDGLMSHVINSGGHTHLVLIDPVRPAVAVYQITDKGSIELKSMRLIRYDLEMTEFNGSAPLPLDVKKGLERQQ